MKLNQLICKLQQLETDGFGNCDVFVNSDDYECHQILCDSDINTYDRPNSFIDDDYIELLKTHAKSVDVDAPCIHIG